VELPLHTRVATSGKAATAAMATERSCSRGISSSWQLPLTVISGVQGALVRHDEAAHIMVVVGRWDGGRVGAQSR